MGDLDEKCHLCDEPMHHRDDHGLGECVDVCDECGGSGDGEINTGPDPCNEPCSACLGSGGVPWGTQNEEKAND